MPSSLKPTPPSPFNRRTSAAAGVFLLIFLATALLSTAWLLARGAIQFVPAHVTSDSLLHGGITHDFAKQLSKAPLAQQAAHLERGTSWLLLHDTGARVRQGCSGWLFLAEEFTLNRNAAANAHDKARTVIELDQALARRGIRLLVIVVPDKSRIAATQRCALYRPTQFEGRIREWLDSLRSAGVAVLDLSATLQPLADQAFLHTDTHWSEGAAHAAAIAVGQQVQTLAIRATPAKTYETHQDRPAVRPGDLVRLAGLDWLPPSLQPMADVVINTRINQRTDPSSTATQALFDNQELPNVALIGTSFSRNSNFVGFLQIALGAAIGNFSEDGGGFSGAAHAYFNSPAFKQTPPKLILWEVPERDLQTPYNHDLDLNLD